MIKGIKEILREIFRDQNTTKQKQTKGQDEEEEKNDENEGHSAFNLKTICLDPTRPSLVRSMIIPIFFFSFLLLVLLVFFLSDDEKKPFLSPSSSSILSRRQTKHGPIRKSRFFFTIEDVMDRIESSINE